QSGMGNREGSPPPAAAPLFHQKQGIGLPIPHSHHSPFPISDSQGRGGGGRLLHSRQRRLLHGGAVPDDRDLEDLVERGHRMKLERLPYILGQVLQVRFVILGQDDSLDSRAMRAEYLLLQSANRQHAAAQRDFS